MRADSRVRIGRWKFQGGGQLEGSRCHWDRRVGSAVWVRYYLAGWLFRLLLCGTSSIFMRGFVE